MSVLSKVTSKYQATIPVEIRTFLGVRQGDTVAYTIVDDVVTLQRATPLDLAYHGAVAATLTEWESKADDDAYGSL